MAHVFRITIEEESSIKSFDDALRLAIQEAERVFEERFGMPRVTVEYLGDNLQDEPGLEVHSTRDWGAEGVFWTGVPGEEIERLDEHPVFDGDMEAAIFVARNGFPWVFYEHDTVDHWSVTAFPTREDAERAVVEAKLPAFAFDGREVDADEVPDGPDGYGYMPPGGAITNRMENA